MTQEIEQVQEEQASNEAADAQEQNDEAAVEAVEPVEPDVLDRRIEAVLLSVDRPLAAAKVAEACGADGAKAVKESVERLNAFYEESTRSFRIEQLAGGYQLLTIPEYRDAVSALHKTKEETKLSPAAIETLAIIAYKQPIMRAQIEAIRGVASGELVRSLMDRHLIKIVGRAEELGRPMLYGTTKTFLELFGLANLKDLPNAKELLKP